jgi:hypothetical protein
MKRNEHDILYLAACAGISGEVVSNWRVRFHTILGTVACRRMQIRGLDFNPKIHGDIQLDNLMYNQPELKTI